MTCFQTTDTPERRLTAAAQTLLRQRLEAETQQKEEAKKKKRINDAVSDGLTAKPGQKQHKVMVIGT